jgi:hypothetical protein
MSCSFVDALAGWEATNDYASNLVIRGQLRLSWRGRIHAGGGLGQALGDGQLAVEDHLGPGLVGDASQGGVQAGRLRGEDLKLLGQ